MRGQKSRSGSGTRPGFQGGQTPLYRQMPKLRGIAGGAAPPHKLGSVLAQQPSHAATSVHNHTQGHTRFTAALAYVQWFVRATPCSEQFYFLLGPI